MRVRRRLRKPGKFQKELVSRFLQVIILYVIFVALLLYLINRFGLSRRILQNPISALILMGILALILSSVSYWLFMRRISAPIQEMNQKFQSVADGDFSVRIDRNTPFEEINQCLDNFNRMVKELESVEMLRSDFTANVSHEFKTPLSTLMGYATLLQDETLVAEERAEYLQKVLFYAEKLSDLSENILLLSKLENSARDIPSEKYRLDEQIRESILLLEKQWTQKNIEWSIELTSMEWTGPKALMAHVWLNLISNAIKFSPENGSVAIALSRVGEEIRFTVSDEGIGMSEEVQAHIFEKFYQGDTSHKASGNGLGLALCQEIVSKVGGHIYVTSAPEKGSVFLVTFKS